MWSREVITDVIGERVLAKVVPGGDQPVAWLDQPTLLRTTNKHVDRAKKFEFAFRYTRVFHQIDTLLKYSRGDVCGWCNVKAFVGYSVIYLRYLFRTPDSSSSSCSALRTWMDRSESRKPRVLEDRLDEGGQARHATDSPALTECTRRRDADQKPDDVRPRHRHCLFQHWLRFFLSRHFRADGHRVNFRLAFNSCGEVRTIGFTIARFIAIVCQRRLITREQKRPK